MKYFISLLLVINVLVGHSASIKGEVKSNGEIVPFANIGLVGTSYGSASDENGKFEITNVKAGEYTLQVSAVGFKNKRQTIVVKEEDVLNVKIEMESSTEQLGEVVVTGTLNEVSIMESAVPIEVYTPKYFKKNPTPALFESLQIVNGVRPQINCSVCNTGDVHINGMEGPYTMVTIDGMPIVGGLASVYGLNGIPNSMIQQMEVVKGPASTLFGSEAVGGLINVITKSPETAPEFSFDVFGTTWGEINTDVSVKSKVTDNIVTTLGVNYFNYSNPIDNNDDNFTDVTLQDRISVFNKWGIKRKDYREASIGLRYIYEDRWGGEMQWTPEFRGGDSIYGESIYTSRYEIIGKYQLPFKEKVITSFSYSDHQQNSQYGNTSYIADQKIAFGQVFMTKKIKDLHQLMVGAALRYNYYDDNTPATQTADSINPTNRPDNYMLPGVFIQDEIDLNEYNKVLLGMRYDYDERHGNIYTPRFNYKLTVNDNNIFRFGAGTGYRVVNLFTEDHAATIGARDVIIVGELKPEKSYNFNLSYQKFINTKFGFVNFDASLFYTYFTNKIAPDYDSNPQQIVYDNLKGNAVSRGGSFNTSINFAIPLNIKFGATFLDVYQNEENMAGELEKQEQLLTEKISATYSVGYTFDKPKIKIDYSGNLYGPMKLPLVENDFRPEYSDWYSIQNIQLTKTLKKGWEIYGGVKNILNFTPPDYSILRANDPFDKNVNSPDNPNGYTFDPTYVYAPNQGVRGFFGVRYTFYK